MAKHRRRVKRAPSFFNQLDSTISHHNDQDSSNAIEIEYTDSIFDDNDPSYSEIKEVFDRFATLEQTNKTFDDNDSFQYIQEMDTEDIDSKLNETALSKKKARKLMRTTVAELKQHSNRPEVVEWVDVTASDPLLLISLKSIHNSVSIPVHWGQKRKYLQGKRGIEKPPFELPSYIRDTGITEQRQAVRDKEISKGLKSKTREKLLPKLGKLHLDYERLHDAFFRFQTKPRMTVFGDLYYEGKEYEKKYLDKRPGIISEELRNALGMIGPLSPPPWLVNMQRYGPPPSYPHLKIPGLNSPIPSGAQWGYQPGGWGKVPVNEHGRPLYGDVFGVINLDSSHQYEGITSWMDSYIQKDKWGEITIFEDTIVIPEQEEQIEEESIVEEEQIASSEYEIQSIPDIPELDVPDFVQLRKEAKKTLEEETVPKSLYTIIPEKTSQITDGFLKPQHGYIIDEPKKTESLIPLEQLARSTQESSSSKKGKVVKKEFEF